MPREVQAGTLPTFTQDLSALPHEILSAPGPDAWLLKIGLDRTHLVSTGVSNCVILTLFYPRTGLRAMAHYNVFGGPTESDFGRHLDGMKKWLRVGDLVASVSCNGLFSGGRSNKPRLLQVLDRVLPEVDEVHVWTFNRPEGRTNKVRIYLAPDGTLSGSAEL